MQGVCKEGGFYSNTANDVDIEEGDHIRRRIGEGDAHAADPHAGEPCWKRIRPSAP